MIPMMRPTEELPEEEFASIFVLLKLQLKSLLFHSYPSMQRQDALIELLTDLSIKEQSIREQSEMLLFHS